MKLKYLLVSFILVSVSCQNSQSSLKKKFMQAKYSAIMPGSVRNLHDVYLDSLLQYEPQLLSFDDDTSYAPDSILLYTVEFGWTVYLVKGTLLPSKAEYHFYGVKKNSDYQLGFYSMPIEIETLLTDYIVTKKRIQVNGMQWDESGLDDGSKPPKKSAIIIEFP